MATLTGTSGNDTLTGTSSADTLVGSGGNDFYDGAGGSDTLDFRGTSTATIVDFTAGTISGGFTGSFANIERVLAGNGADHLIGGVGAQNLSGRAGADTLEGGAGNDWLWGGGGAENHYVFRETGPANADQVGDFISGADKIVLDASVMNALGAEGNFAAGDARFAANTSGTAQDASDRVIYETDTRQIWYDPDGNGSAARQLIATLQSGATLTATDIVVEGADTPPPSGTTGTEGDDTLVGTPGNDTIDGLGGNDLLAGGSGWDTVTGGTGQDTFAFAEFGSGMNDNITDFASGIDTLQLDAAAFTAMGASGRFTAGDARFFAAPGASSGHDADDRLIYDTTTGVLYYDTDGNGPGGEARVAILDGAPPLAATDILVVNASSSGSIDGTAGDDTLVGTPGDDTINGLGGDDSISGLAGHDSLSGGDGNDSLDGGENSDTLDGGLGNDTYFVNFTQAGDFTSDQVVDAGGVDTVVALSAGLRSSWTLGSGLENLEVYGLSGTGNELNNVIRNNEPGGESAPVLNGMGGNDTLLGSANSFEIFVFTGDYGNDVVDGGGPFSSDEIDVGDGSAVLVDFRAGTATGGGPGDSGTITFTNVSRAAGGDFNDTLIGAAGDNGLFGNGGDDTLNGGAGNDFMNGGAGADAFFFDQAPGTSNSDQIIDFSSGVDHIHLDATAMPGLGASGAFSVNDSRFFAAAGATGGHDADDRVVFDTSSGLLYYDPDGNDTAAGQVLGSVFLGGAPASLVATDIVIDNGAAPTPGETITGTNGADTLTGTAADDTLDGLGGNDSISGLEGNDSLNGGSGNDTLDGGPGSDTMTGGAGDDMYMVTPGDVLADSGGIELVVTSTAWTLGAGFENATLHAVGPGSTQVTGNELDNVMRGDGPGVALWGLGGDDQLFGGSMADNLVGFDGNDSLIGGAGNDGLEGDSGNDFLDGGDGNDIFQGAAGDDTMLGGAGNDEFWMGPGTSGPGTPLTIGRDAIDGGAGFDYIRFDFGPFPAPDGVSINLGSGTFSRPSEGGGTVTNVEGAVGTDLADALVGDTAGNAFNGSTGDDTINAGAGVDTLTGGDGSDHFIFSSPGFANFDFVNDFASGTDEIELDAEAMTALGASGSFTTGDERFYAAPGANAGHDATDRVVYNTSTGQLWYDADGNGSAAAIPIATLFNRAPLSATDIEVVNGASGTPGETITGTSGNDTLTGTVGNDTFNGLGGNDELLGSGGTDFYDGGAGNDTLNFRLTSTATVVDFVSGTISGGFSGTFANMERVLAGNGADSLTGGSGAQNLSGRAGSDTLEGGAGNDWLWGGGNEVDTFVFREAGAANADDVGDLTSSVDRIALDNATMAALGADGAFAGGDARFFAAAGAAAGHDANDRVVYNTSTGQLYYDDDGSSAHAAQLIATLHGAPTLAAAEITVI